MKHLDLFSGIGGFALAARWVGWETVGFCEIDPYCQKVLAKHWPGVPIYDDVTKLQCGVKGYTTDGTTTVGPIDVITGGFPCQDISYAGKGAGIDGERSGLWTELARLIGEVRPRYAVLENVAALLSRGLDRVAGDLVEIGYDCEWHCIPAAAVGAPHRRDRIWIVAYPAGDIRRASGDEVDYAPNGSGTELRHANGQGEPVGSVDAKASELRSNVADSIGARLERQLKAGPASRSTDRSSDGRDRGWWTTEPDVGRVANGVPRRVDRLRGLGNAIVPQVAQVIFEAINEIRD